MLYVEGFVTPVPIENKQAYVDMAMICAEVFKDHGALTVVECWGVDVPDGKLTSFSKAVLCKANETVVLSWIIWPSKEVRDIGMEKSFTDPRIKMDAMPFDGKRLIFGGFEMLLSE